MFTLGGVFMEVSEIQSMCVSGSEAYYKYLESHGRGLSSLSVHTIEAAGDGLYLLHLYSRLSPSAADHLDDLFFRYNGRIFTASEEIRIVHYSPMKAVLTVRPGRRFPYDFSLIRPGQIEVCSDMKFLVKRVRDWYSTHGSEIHPPHEIFARVPPPIIPVSNPTQEQMQAIQGALSSSLSYVWGAPGTGKTRVVLSSCVLSLMRSEKKVLIVAPTNNALEQMLYGLIPVLRENGISYKEILRLGIPSAGFARKYPWVCEPGGLSSQISQLEKDISSMKDCMEFRGKRRNLFQAVDAVNQIFAQLHTFRSSLLPVLKSVDDIAKELFHLKRDVWSRDREIDSLSSTYHRSKDALQRANSSIFRHIFRKHYRRLLAQEDGDFHSLMSAQAKLNELIALQEEAEHQLDEENEKVYTLTLQFTSLKDELLSVCSFSPELSKCAEQLRPTNITGTYKKLCTKLDRNLKKLPQNAPMYAAYGNLSDEDISSALIDLTDQLQCMELPVEERISAATLVAATMDKFMVFSSDSFTPRHVFLDEAGYCPLIKAAALTSLGVPITLLGDHMQLPPVFEMDAKKDLSSPSNQGASVWGQSAVYLDTLFHSTESEVLFSFCSGSPPPFPDLKMYSLNGTHRFGPALASILASHVYTPRFHSCVDTDTQLLVMNAPKMAGGTPRTSPAEVTAIAQFLRTHYEDDFAVLTPYRKQLDLLNKSFPVLSKNARVLTVHASQGREWDTVIFSVVDTIDMWYCNTLRLETKGLQVINAAVSRARKRLVLVCDYDYWISQPGQLIGQLVQSAKRLN